MYYCSSDCERDLNVGSNTERLVGGGAPGQTISEQLKEDEFHPTHPSFSNSEDDSRKKTPDPSMRIVLLRVIDSGTSETTLPFS